MKLESENHLLYHLHHFHLSASIHIHSDRWIRGADFCMRNRLYPCSYDFAQPSLCMRPSAVSSKRLESSPSPFLPGDFRQVVLKEFCALVSFLENSDFDNTCLPPQQSSCENYWDYMVRGWEEFMVLEDWICDGCYSWLISTPWMAASFFSWQSIWKSPQITHLGE